MTTTRREGTGLRTEPWSDEAADAIREFQQLGSQVAASIRHIFMDIVKAQKPYILCKSVAPTIVDRGARKYIFLRFYWKNNLASMRDCHRKSKLLTAVLVFGDRRDIECTIHFVQGNVSDPESMVDSFNFFNESICSIHAEMVKRSNSWHLSRTCSIGRVPRGQRNVSYHAGDHALAFMVHILGMARHGKFSWKIDDQSDLHDSLVENDAHDCEHRRGSYGVSIEKVLGNAEDAADEEDVREAEPNWILVGTETGALKDFVKLPGWWENQ